MNPIIKLCRERAEGYGAMRHTALTAIALDKAADEIERLDTNGIHSCHDECTRPMCVQRRRIEALEAALRWYADQMCDGLCQGKDPKACAAIGEDNCSGCPAVVALHKTA